MTRKNIILMFAIYWLISTVINTGAMHASDTARWHDVKYEMRECRKDLGFAVFWGVLPFTTPIGFFLTGFWYDGFRWDCKDAK